MLSRATLRENAERFADWKAWRNRDPHRPGLPPGAVDQALVQHYVPALRDLLAQPSPLVTYLESTQHDRI